VPDVNIYGSPPTAPTAGASALSDPLKLIGALRQLQDYQIVRQQAPALAQQPAAALEGTRIANETARLQQQNIAQQTIYHFLASKASGIDNPTADDIHGLTAEAARTFPHIQLQYPDMINAAADIALKEPRGVKAGVANIVNLATPPDAGMVTATDPSTGQPVTMTRQQANTMALGPGARPAPAAPSSSLPGFASGTPPGTEASAGVMQADLARAGNFKTDVFPLTQALDLAKKLGPGGMAPGSKGRQDFESFVYGLMPSLVPEAAREKIKNYAELEKYLVNNASVRANAMGPHTNDGLAQATTGSPNVHINDLAGIDLIKAQIGLRRMEHAQALEAAKGGPVNYTANKAKTAAGLDPRAFQIDMMEPGQIAKLQKTLKGAERVKFNASLRAAIDSGAIERP
jgi:hypothetical protein